MLKLNGLPEKIALLPVVSGGANSKAFWIWAAIMRDFVRRIMFKIRPLPLLQRERYMFKDLAHEEPGPVFWKSSFCAAQNGALALWMWNFHCVTPACAMCIDNFIKIFHLKNLKTMSINFMIINKSFKKLQFLQTYELIVN